MRGVVACVSRSWLGVLSALIIAAGIVAGTFIASNTVSYVKTLSSSLIDQGVVFSSQRLQYFYTRLASLRVQLLAAATKDAQARARKIAGSTGARLGQLMTASSGVIQVTPLNSTQISNQGSYDTSTIQKQVTAVVRASFALSS